MTVNMSERGAALLSKGEIQPLAINLFPNYLTRRGLQTSRLHAFAGGLVYTVPAIFGQTPTLRPLFYLQDLTKGAFQIEAFSDAAVQDIKVRDGHCYVLTAEPEIDPEAKGTGGQEGNLRAGLR